MITYPGRLIIHSVQRIMNMCECQATTPAWWLYHIKHLMRWDKLLILRAEGSNYFFLKLLKNVRLEISVQLVIGDNVRGQHNFFLFCKPFKFFFFFWQCSLCRMDLTLFCLTLMIPRQTFHLTAWIFWQAQVSQCNIFCGYSDWNVL